MNKKADVEISKLIVIILAVIALLLVGLFVYQTFSSSSKEVTNIGKNLKTDSNLFDTKPLLEVEAEKCLSGKNNIDICLGLGNCFYGKFEDTNSCFSCLDDKYFKDKQCDSYEKFISKLSQVEAKLVCESNPCNFKVLSELKKVFAGCKFDKEPSGQFSCDNQFTPKA
ncbi:hypothetical protein HYX16_04545 [Candidatus Woesearchaeota archaeon]|nr:hypothetical protein [Candidatus Woesearchaeota archaeon]